MAGKLGKLPPRVDPRTLKLQNYLKPALPPPPLQADWTYGITQPYGMMANDSVGDCTCAAAGHAIQVWTANSGNEVTLSDDAVLAAYEAVSGYDPSDPSTDQGAVLLDVLKFWRKVGIGGRTIHAFASVDPTNLDLVRNGIHLFGGLIIGIRFPQSARHQKVWTVVPGSPIEGGHAIALPRYWASGPFCITWGERQMMTWDFFQSYCDEAWAIISEDFMSGNVSASALDMDALHADLDMIGRTVA